MRFSICRRRRAELLAAPAWHAAFRPAIVMAWANDQLHLPAGRCRLYAAAQAFSLALVHLRTGTRTRRYTRECASPANLHFVSFLEVQ